MSGIRTEKEFVDKLYKSLDLLFCNFLPTKKVVIAIDGASPYSKILLQRKRRLQSVSKLDVDKITPILLTPGTEFIKKVNNYLQLYIKKMQNRYQYINVEFEYLSTELPDEGEIKIFKKMLEHSKTDPFTSHLVIGNDADLVVLAVALKTVPNISILIRHQGCTEVLSIDRLISRFCSRIPILVISKNDWRSDFTVVSLMMGNDYLPKLNYIKYESVWSSYFATVNDVKRTMISDRKFDREVLKLFFTKLVGNLSSKFQKFNEDDYDRDVVVNYLEGLLWCLNMYETGECSMYDYVFRFKSSPTPADVRHFLESTDEQINVPMSDTPPINSDMYTLLVMPKKAKKLVPKQYQKYMDGELKGIYESEECGECAKLKGELSKHHKQMHEHRTKHPDDNDGLNAIKQQIGGVSKEFAKHKKEHPNEFSIKDIERIIKITESGK
jgi:5'-3' exonuclease